ncbi:hypothetical protein HYPSUDRAFT_144172 [Hypholoma sublateritium FD-334 SS-4]|uniref:Uncharacterized protein n=1 Tax=Hypholoma sublateritium (strain FD-334 SS-4) TaxID=945553 RepID=A0A0D2NJK9_HYPSF|nr:hypothetical protein HYPSUDRAFT_144172 [Hypholoma sublateritium FD-334 SS-4]
MSPNGTDANGLSAKPVPRALTSKQERRLVDFLDETFLQLTRNFKKRSEASSKAQTLPAYLEETRHILALILQIPPIDPSTSLRTAYLLRLTGDSLGSIPGYKIGTGDGVREILQDLADFLDDLDQAWVAVLKGQVWDPRTAEGVDLNINTDSSALPRPLKSSPPSQTDLTRLRSLLLSGESALEDWMSNDGAQGDEAAPDESEDVSTMLDRLGLLDDFDSLFARTFGLLGEFGGDNSAQDLNSDLADTMELDL